MRTRCVYNKFGYRKFYFDRISEVLPDAIAWIGQSTTACVANRGLVAVEAEEEMMRDLDIQFLIQVHDELVFQYPIRYRTEALKAIRPLVHVTVPYEDPLMIPWRLKTSQVSWGHCAASEWPQ